MQEHLSRIVTIGIESPMRLKKFFAHSPDLLVPLAIGAVAVVLSYTSTLEPLRILFLLTCAMAILVNKRKPLPLRIRRFPALLLLPLIMYALLVFVNLNRADVFADEYDFGYQA